MTSVAGPTRASSTWRVFWLGLSLDVAITLGAVIPTLAGDARWTARYTVAVIVSVGKTLLTAAANYTANYLRGLQGP